MIFSLLTKIVVTAMIVYLTVIVTVELTIVHLFSSVDSGCIGVTWLAT